MEFHNIMTCPGAYIDCSMALLGIVILFFVIAALRKWLFEAMDYPFNFWIGMIVGIVSYIIAYGFTGSYKISLVVGLIAGLALGYFGAGFIEGDSP
jgi:hypothetical protein